MSIRKIGEGSLFSSAHIEAKFFEFFYLTWIHPPCIVRVNLTETNKGVDEEK
jgi:hypothetical protein